MIKGFLPLLFSSGGAVVAGAVGYTIITSTPPQEPPVSDKIETVAPQVATEPVAPDPAIEVAKVDPEVVTPPKIPVPVFSVLRIEPDGSAVIAGTGPANSEIKLFNSGVEIATTQSGGSGDFAFVLDEPLAPGSHELTLQALLPSGETLVSNEAGFVSVPDAEKPEELAVLVAEPGEASRILVKPKPAEPEVTQAQATASVEVQGETQGEELTVTVEEVDPLKPETSKALKPVLLEAADIEGGKIFIAGTGEPGASVNIYVGGEFIGQAKVADNGSFLFEGTHDLASGRHDVRADMIAAGSADVVARAEVELVHQIEAVSDEVEGTLAEASDSGEKILRTGAAVIIRRGDSLWKVARRNYGVGVRYTTIFEANRDQVTNPDLIFPGQVLKVPEADVEATPSEDG
jgi:nucleoid-associated protein YgaU